MVMSALVGKRHVEVDIRRRNDYAMALVMLLRKVKNITVRKKLRASSHCSIGKHMNELLRNFCSSFPCDYQQFRPINSNALLEKFQLHRFVFRNPVSIILGLTQRS